MPLSEILGVTVDEILRGELSTSVVMLNTLPKETAPSIHTANNALAYRAAKKLLIRDSLIVIPLMLFTVLWLVLRLGFHVDFAPGGDHSSSMIANLIIPLFVIGFGQLVYASFLVTDTIRIKKDAVFLKILAVIGVWFAVMYLFPVVYIRRIVVYFKRVSDFKNNKETSHL